MTSLTGPHFDTSHQDMETRWNEEKMKKRAEALFGVTTTEDDPKIYSQLQVDEMYEQWRKDQVDPLFEERDDRLV